ncbi:MAG: class I mannose-6-phosphate isomerase [Chloroflexi bacterium]|nr:class I mannose-6-phosphate isomerase [Chloroflexota bacterium]
MLYPLTFHPIFQERVWGGRKLEDLYQKCLPPDVPIGESWEIADRPEAMSVIAHGPLAGYNLRWLMEHHRPELLGTGKTWPERFPLLVKILDARERLSLQVHPPAHKARPLQGEAKTEMWYITEAAPGAELFAGLKRGVTRSEFEEKLRDGTVADCIHRLPVQAGDALFLPSGRLHGLGAGIALFEIQQNSDTTYRVFDWNRPGRDGRPRQLHVAQSLECIDFNDFEPRLIAVQTADEKEGRRVQTLVSGPVFQVKLFTAPAGGGVEFPGQEMSVLGVVGGQLALRAMEIELRLKAGQFCLVPACLGAWRVQAQTAVRFLLATAGQC